MLVGDCLENLLVRGLDRHVGSAGSAPRYQAAALGDTQAVHLRDHANTSLGTGPISRPLGSTEGTAQTLPSDSRDLGPSTFGPYLLVHFLKANVGFSAIALSRTLYRPQPRPYKKPRFPIRV